MIGLLALIGLKTIHKTTIKGLKRLANVGDALIDMAAEAHKNRNNPSAEKIQQKLNKIENKIKSLKGDEDAQYHEKVRREIDEITGT
jgi:TolA-binding protein